MIDWPIGFSTGCFYRTPIADVLGDIRDGGFRLLEICSFPDHLPYQDLGAVRKARDMIQDHDLEAFSFHAPFGVEIDITALDENRRQQALDALLSACEAAAILGARHFVIHPGPEREGKVCAEELYQRMRNAAETLNMVARHCREVGLLLLMENMLPHLLFGHTSDILYMLGAVEGTNVGACLDTGHANLSGELFDVVHKMSGHLKMVHANDNRGDGDFHLVPGDGHIDWKRMVRELSDVRFQGTVILELAGGNGVSPDEMLARGRRGRSFLHEIFRELDEQSSQVSC